MLKVKFYMKSRNIIEFECEEITITRDSFGKLVGYEIDNGNSKKRLLDATLSNVDGIVVEDIQATKEGLNDN